MYRGATGEPRVEGDIPESQSETPGNNDSL